MAVRAKFNLNRFGLLLKQDWYSNRKKYGFQLVSLFLIYLLLDHLFKSNIKEYIVSGNYDGIKIYKNYFIFFMMGAMTLSPSNFTAFTTKINAANYLLTPGSALEKFLASFFIRVVVLVTIYLGLVITIININTAFISSEKINSTTYFDASLIPPFQFQYLVGVNNQCQLWNWLVVLNLYSLATIFMSKLFIGKIKTPKFKIVKASIITVFFLFLGLVLLPIFIRGHYYKKLDFSELLPEAFDISQHFDSIDVFWMSILPLTALTAFLMAYYSLKERDVK